MLHINQSIPMLMHIYLNIYLARYIHTHYLTLISILYTLVCRLLSLFSTWYVCTVCLNYFGACVNYVCICMSDYKFKPTIIDCFFCLSDHLYMHADTNQMIICFIAYNKEKLVMLDQN